MCQAILKTKKDGIVSLILPYEWISRPSFNSINEYIKTNKWEVSVYKFSESIFKNVATTASITIIDKSKKTNRWNYYNINKDFEISKIENPTGTNRDIIKHTPRTSVSYAQRGMSPGVMVKFFRRHF